jgi:hypothetical protein
VEFIRKHRIDTPARSILIVLACKLAHRAFIIGYHEHVGLLDIVIQDISLNYELATFCKRNKAI